jgi:DNA invertase Pin-like site-specific DNA recombinase
MRTRSRWRFIASTYCDGTAENSLHEIRLRSRINGPPKPRRASEAVARRRSREGFGAKTDRVQLRRAVDQLDEGDVLTVTRLDRLARSTRDLLNTLAAIADNGAGFRSLHDTWADSTTAHGRLMLAVLGGLAECESSLIHTLTGEGRERAKARGVKMGRRPKLADHQKREAIKRLKAGKETQGEIARSYNVSRWTISRLEQRTAQSVVLVHKVSQLAIAERAAGLIVTFGFIVRASE